MATSRKTAKSPAPKDFENALAELEQLVERMESGALVLDDLLTNYQRGAELITYCKDKLKSVEEQVQVLNAGELKSLLNEPKSE